MKSKDLDILKKLQKGDHSGYKDLFDLYYIPLSMYSLKFCDSFDLSEDIVQEIFVKFWNDKIYMKLEGTIAPYLFKSVKNNTLQLLKKENNFKFENIEDEVNNLLEDEEIDVENLEEERDKLFKEIEALPTKSKEVFKLIVLDNYKYKETAEQLNISVNTVKTHYSRALKQLRKSLDIIIILLLI